jgi:hypothetical protein
MVAPDAAVINCYRLAEIYGRNPAEFLALPIEEVFDHIFWTDRMFAAGERWKKRG